MLDRMHAVVKEDLETMDMISEVEALTEDEIIDIIEEQPLPADTSSHILD